MPSTRVYAPFLAAALLVGSAASAVTVNPISPSLPLSDHAVVGCPTPGLGTGTPTTIIGKTDSATCDYSHIVEDPVSLTYVLGRGQATSSLRTGTLRSHSTGYSYRFDLTPSHQINIQAIGFSSAYLYDTITFQGSGIVELRMTVHGTMMADQVTGGVANSAGGSLLMCGGACDSGYWDGEASVRTEWVGAPAAGALPELRGMSATGWAAATTNANSSGYFVDPNDMSFTMSVFMNVSNSTSTFVAQLVTSASFSPVISFDRALVSDVDFGNTAQLELIVPQGVTWTSASGVFLVPEPSLLALFVAAATGLGWIGRRRT